MWGPDSRKAAGGRIAALDPPVPAPTRVREAHPRDHVVELAAGYAQELCRVLLDPAGSPERLLYKGALHRLERERDPGKEARKLPCAPGTCRQGRRFGQPDVRGIDAGAVRHEDGALQGVP